MVLTESQAQVASAIESRLLEAGANVPSLDELRAAVGGQDFDAITKLLSETGRVVKVTSTLLFHPETIERIRGAITRHFESERDLGVPQFKDMIGISRKYAIPLLEYFDRIGLTKREGDYRVLR